MCAHGMYSERLVSVDHVMFTCICCACVYMASPAFLGVGGGGGQDRVMGYHLTAEYNYGGGGGGGAHVPSNTEYFNFY